MVGFLLIISFWSCAAVVYKLVASANSKRSIVVSTVLVFSLILVGLTETLSLINQLNINGLILSWGLVILCCIGFVGKNGIQDFYALQKSVFTKIVAWIKQQNRVERGLFLTIVIIAIATFFQGLIYPPNSIDSMSYHLTRIVHWISNESVAHYPTSDYRELYQPPLSEFFLLQINLLFGTDFFANSLQWFFLFFSGISASLIAKKLGLNRQYQLLSVFLIYTIPIAIFQASSTKNFIVQAFFLLEVIRLILGLVQQRDKINISDSENFQSTRTVRTQSTDSSTIYKNKTNLFPLFLLGIAIGMALLAKATSYIFLFPILLIYGLWVLKSTFRKKQYTFLWANLLVVGILAIGINSGHYSRGYQLTGHLLGLPTGTGPKVTVVHPSISTIFSNLIRNIALHIGPFPISRISEIGTKKVHETLGLDVNAETIHQLPFKVSNYPNGVGDAPNLIHLVLVLLTFAYLLKTPNPRILKWAAGIFIVQMVLFCFYLQWQPWHSRLHVPWFIMTMPFVAYFFSKTTVFSKIQVFILAGLGLYALLVLPFCNSRPLIYLSNVTQEISPWDNRYEKQFSGRPELYPDYLKIRKKLDSTNFSYIGSEIHGANWSYPLFSNIYTKKIKLYAVNVAGFTNRNPQVVPSLDFIISQKTNRDSIEFQGKMYYKKELDTKILFLYAPQ